MGLAIGLLGQLSLLCLVVPQAIYLVPLSRFLGFAWLILSGFKLPKGRERGRTRDFTGMRPIPPTVAAG